MLRVFVTVVDAGGFSAAQAVLNIGQSTVSAHIAALEERLGYRLCTRGRAGFQLTENGRSTYSAARRLLEAAKSFSQEAAGLRTLLSGRVRLGLPDGAITDPGSPIVAGLTKFAARTSEVELLVSCNQPTEVAKALAADELDVAIATFPRPIPHLVHRPLYIEESGVFCGDRHPLFQRSDERLLEEARHYPFATHAHWFGEDLRAMGIGKAHATVHQIEAVATLILAGGHIGFLPIHYAQRWVDGGAMKRIGATEVTSACRFDVVTRRGMDTTPAVSAIIEDLFWRKGPALEPENYQIPAG